MDTVYDEKRVASITHEVAEAIDLASFGKVSWNVAAEIFISSFPGCCASLVNQDFVHNSINFLESVNIDENFLSTYVEHFAYINPWVDIFTKMPSGTVFVTEEHLPSNKISNTEFYNDWLLPQGDLLAGVGLKVDASPTDVIYFPVHYPGRLAHTYDRPAAEVSRRLVGALKRAIHTTNDLLREKEGPLSTAALTDRFWPAIIVDSTMRLCGANREAEDLLKRRRAMICKNGRISFQNPVFSQRVATAVVDLAASVASETSSCGWRDPQDSLIVQLSRLPKAHPLNTSLVSERTKILCVVKMLSRGPKPPDLTAFGEAFGLSRSEVLLCLSLYAGRSLQEAAVELGITYGTVRDRAKVVFQKTGVRGQPGLCALLARYSG
ncbi:MAG: hypothetical protein JNK47_23925 [Mesorhizobium sp.]|nr:hypothetical protein [Mesorhizobium sp.]MBL8580257.1 hypothetical protein [Mesorhizobium sp.]